MALKKMLLPMSKGDIAAYLGIRPESLSRALTQLKKEGVVRNVGNFIAGLQFRHLGGGLAHPLPDEGDSALFVVGAGDCQRNPLGVLVIKADNDKLTRFSRAGDEGSLDFSGENVV